MRYYSSVMSDQIISKYKFVEFRYRIMEGDGNILEHIDLPVHYVHGTDNGMFPKIEQSLSGCKEGDSISVVLTPAEAFGDYYDELIYTDDLKNVPEQFHEIGAEVEFQSDRGESRQFRVTNIEDGMLTLDGNHPLAGKELTFTIDIIKVRDATEEEIKEGHGLHSTTSIH